MNTMFLSFVSDLEKELVTTFQDFSCTKKLSQFSKNPYEISPAIEWMMYHDWLHTYTLDINTQYIFILQNEFLKK